MITNAGRVSADAVSDTTPRRTSHVAVRCGRKDIMGILQKLGTGQGFAKVGMLGFPKSGKTYTATLIALGIREHFGLKGPIAMFDTEGGSEYVAPTIRKAGVEFVGVRSRSFGDLIAATQEAEAEASVLIVDSITHVWRELCDAYMKRINELRAAKRQPLRTRMTLQEIMATKELWSPWPTLYLNSKLHIIICGRAGFEWDHVENEETGERELTKTGVKMKVEAEFGFEPSLLVEMERVQNLADGQTRLLHRATIIGDRFNVIDATQCDNPTYEFFKPHMDLLRAGAHAPVDANVKTDVPVDDDGNTEWQREKRERAILCEEIQGLLMKAWPGQTAAEKKAKAEAIESAFQTRSWTKVESLNSATLRDGIERIKSIVESAESKEVAA